MSENIRRAERKEEEARHLLREAAYLRDLEKRLAAAKNKPEPLNTCPDYVAGRCDITLAYQRCKDCPCDDASPALKAARAL